MSIKYNQHLVGAAKSLRKNMTDEEKHLWYDFLKKLPLTVNRQKNIGDYIVDFYIASKKIVIEIDGAQHNSRDGKKRDFERDRELRDIGIVVLRYSNRDINQNFHTVCNDILNKLNLKASDML